MQPLAGDQPVLASTCLLNLGGPFSYLFYLEWGRWLGGTLRFTCGSVFCLSNLGEPLPYLFWVSISLHLVSAPVLDSAALSGLVEGDPGKESLPGGVHSSVPGAERVQGPGMTASLTKDGYRALISLGASRNVGRKIMRSKSELGEVRELISH